MLCFITCQHSHSCSLSFSLWPPIDFPHLSVQLKCSSLGKRPSWYLFVTHIDFLATFFPSEGKHRQVYLRLSCQIFIRKRVVWPLEQWSIHWFIHHSYFLASRTAVVMFSMCLYYTLWRCKKNGIGNFS